MLRNIKEMLDSNKMFQSAIDAEFSRGNVGNHQMLN
jgi:hypothetical protein